MSLVISVHNGSSDLERCLESLSSQRDELHELIVVDDGSTDSSGAVAQTAGCQLIRLPDRRGLRAARNVGALAASGEVVVFIDTDTIVLPGWASALRAAFADGAKLVGGGISQPEPRTLAEWYEFGSGWHDAHAANGFLPFASGAHVAIRRDLFLELRGWDELLLGGEDVDLSFRAGLAGHRVSFVPEAKLVHWPRDTIRAQLAQRKRHGRGARYVEWKFRQFPFLHIGRNVRHIARGSAVIAARVLLEGTAGDPRRLLLPALSGAAATAKRIGRLQADLELLLGLQPVPEPVPYADPVQHSLASPLPGRPTVLLLGNDRIVMRILRLILRGGPQLGIALPGLEREALERWEEPAPWSLGLVRRARRAGWQLEFPMAAQRLEREQPRTWGEAFLMLHRVSAWQHGKRGFGVAAPGDAGWRLAEKLPDVPVVVAGEARMGGDRVLLSVTRADLLRDRHEMFRRLRQAAGVSPDPRTMAGKP